MSRPRGFRAQPAHGPMLAEILILIGLVISVVGHLQMWVAARRVSTGWFIVCLCWLLWPFFLVAHFPQARRPFAIWLAGLLIAGIGTMLRSG